MTTAFNAETPEKQPYRPKPWNSLTIERTVRDIWVGPEWNRYLAGTEDGTRVLIQLPDNSPHLRPLQQRLTEQGVTFSSERLYHRARGHYVLELSVSGPTSSAASLVQVLARALREVGVFTPEEASEASRQYQQGANMVGEVRGTMQTVWMGNPIRPPAQQLMGGAPITTGAEFRPNGTIVTAGGTIESPPTAGNGHIHTEVEYVRDAQGRLTGTIIAPTHLPPSSIQHQVDAQGKATGGVIATSTGGHITTPATHDADATLCDGCEAASQPPLKGSARG